MINEKISKIREHKQDVLHKVKQILSDLNSAYEDLEHMQELETVDYELFEMQASFLAEHARMFSRLHAAERSYQPVGVAGTELDHSESGAAAETHEQVEQKMHALSPNVFKGEQPELAQQSGADFWRQERAVQTESDSQPEAQRSFPQPEMQPEEESYKEEASRPTSERSEPEDPRSFMRERSAEVSEPATEVVKEVVLEEKELILSEPPKAVEEPEEKRKEEERTLDNAASSTEEKPLSLNDRMSALRKTQAAEGGVSVRGAQRVHDIKSIINLNDKLLFIKDLFNGYSLAYSEAIELLNRYENYNDAVAFLQNSYADKNNWQAKPDTVEKLKAIIRKRFA